ncbi:hypothetical protein PRBRB14_20600 [Hallella multisaccharivorax DSM 17128]|nr:hypothetical protein PRBRB14_20600 [Hallella multisaccharivorax DSM 17128]
MSSLIMRWWEETFAYGWAYGSIGEALKGKKIIFGITAGGIRQSSMPVVLQVSWESRFPIVSKCMPSFAKWIIWAVNSQGAAECRRWHIGDEVRQAMREHVDYQDHKMKSLLRGKLFILQMDMNSLPCRHEVFIGISTYKK